MKFTDIFKDAAEKAKSPKAFVIYASVGVVVTTVGAVWAAKREAKVVTDEMTTQEKIKEEIKTYAPVAVGAIVTVVCIKQIGIQANLMLDMMENVYVRQANAANYYRELAGVAALAEVSKEAKRLRPGDEETIIFHDTWTDRYVELSQADFWYAAYHTERNFQLRGECLVNEFYDFLGIERTPEGEVFGWSYDVMLEDGWTPIFEVASQVSEDGKTASFYFPCPPINLMRFEDWPQE